MSARPRRLGIYAAVLLLAAAGAYWGFRLHWFLTDDAFIAFRFVDNRRLGYGYTWNPPPFLPVEGYTSFAWVLLLDLGWSLFGVEPPVAANALSFALSCGTLAITTWACARWFDSIWLAAAVLLATISQRTFLVWASGGLETALFNVLLQSWALVGLSAREPVRPRTLATLAALAAATALARPEGLLAVAATLAILAAVSALRQLPVRSALASGSPLLLVAAHEAFRRAFYGEWLPNTYYAKVVAAWPEAGVRYLAAFMIEYAYYLALPLWVWGAWTWARTSIRAFVAAHGGGRRTVAGRKIVQAAVLMTLLAKVGFDVFIAGGDHFEYRALSFLVPLLPLAFAFGCAAFGLARRTSAAALVAFAALSAVLPWSVFARDRTRYDWPAKPSPPLAAEVVAPFRPAAAMLDTLEAWLVKRGVGVRHHEHRAFWLHQVKTFPSREEGSRACAQADHPVAALATIGVGGWVLSGCAVLDLRGLADWVIARTPSKLEYLGHDRRPPVDYVRRLKPNLFVNRGELVFLPRPSPLTDDEIRDTELYYRGLLGGGS